MPHLIDYGNNPFIGNSKIPLFDTFQFSIIIENSQQTNYFTEKLMDCLLTKTIPIYWGCPNISDFFNTDGWIIFNNDNLEQLAQKLKSVDSKYYSTYSNIVEENYLKALQWTDIYLNLNNSK